MTDTELRAAWESTVRSEKRGFHEGHRVGLVKGIVLGVCVTTGLVILMVSAMDLWWAWTR